MREDLLQRGIRCSPPLMGLCGVCVRVVFEKKQCFQEKLKERHFVGLFHTLSS